MIILKNKLIKNGLIILLDYQIIILKIELRDLLFSIDSETTSDFDDLFSFQNNILSIYISNVAVWLDILNVWDAFSKRVSTI